MSNRTLHAGRSYRLSGFFIEKNERRPEMAEVIIKSIDELKEIVLESLKDGTVISIRLTDGKEEKDD